MASNSFGTLFRITTWGESHGKAMGVVIDGCPANVSISEEMIFDELKKRRPGHSAYTTSRKEKDRPIILSGVFEGKTTGAPIMVMIENTDHRSQDYEEIRDIYRPSHGQYTYHQKYGHYDQRGSGRFSGRETLSWVAAAAVAKAFLLTHGIECEAYLQQVGDVLIPISTEKDMSDLKKRRDHDPIYCPDCEASEKMQTLIDKSMSDGDSVGGAVGFGIVAPAGLGEPIFEKLEAKLAHGMMSIPGSKGFEIGGGFTLSSMRGSIANDQILAEGEQLKMEQNLSGGVLAGISTGELIYGRVGFKPTPSIKRSQRSADIHGRSKEIQLSATARHDPCIAIRAVPVVEALGALVMADLILMNNEKRVSVDA